MPLGREQERAKMLRNLLIALCAMMMGTQVPMVLSPIGAYIVRDYPNIDPTFAISIVSTPRMFMGMFAAVLLGPIMLRANRKIVGQIFLLIYIIFGAVFLLIGKANGPFMALYGMAFLVGIPAGGYTVLGTTVISENCESSKDRLKLIGRYQAFGALSQVVIVSIAGRLASRNDGYAWPTAFYVVVFPIIGLLIWTTFFPKDAAKAKQIGNGEAKKPVKFTWKAFTVGLVIMAVLHLCFYICSNIYNTSVSQWVITERAIGTAANAADATSIGRIVLMIVGLSQPIIYRYLGKWEIPVGGMFALGGVALLYFGQTLPALYAASICLNIATGCCNFGVNGYCYEVVRPGYGPVAVSVMTLIMLSAGTVTPFLISWLSPIFGGGFNGKLASGLFFGAILVVGSVLFYTTKNRFRYPEFQKVEADSAE